MLCSTMPEPVICVAVHHSFGVQAAPREAGGTVRQLQDISTAAVTEAVSLMASAIAQVWPAMPSMACSVPNALLPHKD